MRTLIQPITKEVGIVTIRGRDYHLQTISYGSRQHIHIFRKGALHLRGMVFDTKQAYEQWRNGMHQLDLPLNGDTCPHPSRLLTLKNDYGQMSNTQVR